ncbi:MAG: VOC family protein [Armatimonadetes bacterium]|nr:VOC family protein [Armatimonadota bacterium]NOG38199.1 VOC family protein [Armatimonadota bacterium]
MSDQNDQHALAEGRAFPWHELYAPNIDQALQFYVDALGFGITEMDMGTGSMYKMLTVDGKAVAGSMDTNSPDMQGVPPHWSVFMTVDDVDARLAKCLELGATVVVPIMEVPTVGRMTLIADPAGAHIWLYQPA